jgi:thiol-disulfide isomerase/thioredoxin
MHGLRRHSVSRASRVKTVVLLGAALVGLAGAVSAADPSQAPALSLPDLKGGQVRIDYGAGKLTLVNFWAVWCGPCREEMPHIAKMVERYSKQGFKAYGIAVQSGEPADVRAFLDENKDFGINYPILMGTDETLERFGDVQAVPTTFLVDSSGKVVRRFLGITPGFPAKLEDEIKNAIAPPAPDPKR